MTDTTPRGDTRERVFPWISRFPPGSRIFFFFFFFSANLSLPLVSASISTIFRPRLPSGGSSHFTRKRAPRNLSFHPLVDLAFSRGSKTPASLFHPWVSCLIAFKNYDSPSTSHRHTQVFSLRAPACLVMGHHSLENVEADRFPCTRYSPSNFSRFPLLPRTLLPREIRRHPPRPSLTIDSLPSPSAQKAITAVSFFLRGFLRLLAERRIARYGRSLLIYYSPRC